MHDMHAIAQIKCVRQATHLCVDCCCCWDGGETAELTLLRALGLALWQHDSQQQQTQQGHQHSTQSKAYVSDHKDDSAGHCRLLRSKTLASPVTCEPAAAVVAAAAPADHTRCSVLSDRHPRQNQPTISHCSPVNQSHTCS